MSRARFEEVQRRKRQQEVNALWPLAQRNERQQRLIDRYIETGDQTYINLLVGYIPPITIPEEVDDDVDVA